DREADRTARDRKRLGLVDPKRPTGDEVVGRDDCEQDRAEQETAVVARERGPEGKDGEYRVDRARDAAPLDVGNDVRPDVRSDVELFGQLVAAGLVAVRVLGGYGVVGHASDVTRATPTSACRSRCADSPAAHGFRPPRS